MSDSAIQSPPGKVAVTPEDSKASTQSTEVANNDGSPPDVPSLESGTQAVTDTNPEQGPPPLKHKSAVSPRQLPKINQPQTAQQLLMTRPTLVTLPRMMKHSNHPYRINHHQLLMKNINHPHRTNTHQWMHPPLKSSSPNRMTCHP